MPQNKNKILVVTGKSGGHVYPAIAFLDTLKINHPEIETLLVLPKESVKYQIDIQHRVDYLPIVSIKPILSLRNIVGAYRFFQGCLKSALILLDFAPDVVVGFGSLVSIPMIVCAWFFRIKVVIHEQNVIPGRATRCLSHVVDRIAISFKETSGYFKPSYIDKIIFTGNPLRLSLRRIDRGSAIDFFGLDKRKITMLVVGGSLGSHRINTEVPRAVSLILDKSNFQVIHISGQADVDLVSDSYKEAKVDARVFAFLASMQHAYSACDFVLSRAGAATVSELLFFKLPALLLPYPYAYRHQFANAKVLESRGSAIIIPDEELSPEKLFMLICDFMANPEKRKAMSLSYAGLGRDNFSSVFTEAVLSF